MSVPIAIAGVSGRMGRALLAAATGDDRVRVTGGSERAELAAQGLDLALLAGEPASGLLASPDPAKACAGAQVWIDFTTPTATLAALAVLRDAGIGAAVIGTTGFDGEAEAALSQAAERLAIVRSGNFSLGVNLLAGLARQAAERLGPDWDIEIIEAHHRGKVDAPSGTALMLGEAAAAGRGVSHGDVAAYARHGQTGARRAGDIGYAVVRAGGIVGEHEVMFAAEDEILRLSHSAGSRTIFARGALQAAVWAATQPPGLYGMGDVLGL